MKRVDLLEELKNKKNCKITHFIGGIDVVIRVHYVGIDGLMRGFIFCNYDIVDSKLVN